MDKATLIGLFLGIGAVIGGQTLEGGHIGSIMQVTAAIIVFGGTLGAVFVSYPFQYVLSSFKEIKKIIKEPPQNPDQIIKQIVTYANKARKEGILSLEKEIKSIDDDFLKKALTMAVDGVEPHTIKEAMATELEYIDEHGKVHSKVFKFVATVYGVGSANLLFLPMSNKLEVRHRHEMILKEMILEGVISVATGENPRLIEEKLNAFLKEKKKTGEALVSSK